MFIGYKEVIPVQI